MSSTIALDSLPYYDTDLISHPHLRPAINSVISVELLSLLPKNSTTPTNLTAFAPVPSTSNTFLASELNRVETKKQIPGLDSTRYNLLLPTTNSLEDFEAAHKNSLIQLEHSHLRTLNNQILASSLGPNSWKIQNFDLESTVTKIDKAGEELRVKVDDLNRERKSSQEKAGIVLTRMEKKWTELISGNLQLEIGCLSLEAEIAQLQAKEAALIARMKTV